MNFKELHKVYHICPSANQAKGEDVFESNTTTDIVHLDHYRECTFFVIKLAGAAGTATATIESCDDTTPSTSTAIAFTYREVTAPNTHGAWTAATSSGVSISAGADEIWEFNVKANGLNSTDEYVRLVLTEVDSTAVDGAVMCLLTDPRYIDSDPDTAGSDAD